MIPLHTTSEIVHKYENHWASPDLIDIKTAMEQEDIEDEQFISLSDLKEWLNNKYNYQVTKKTLLNALSELKGDDKK